MSKPRSKSNGPKSRPARKTDADEVEDKEDEEDEDDEGDDGDDGDDDENEGIDVDNADADETEDSQEDDDPDAVEGTGESERGTSIGEKYDKQMRQLVTQRLDIPLTSLANMIETKQIDVSPKFQRRGRWNDKQRSRFVESIIMNVPIPPVFLGEDEYGKYVVLDGRQRITALYEFIRGHYPLEGLEVWEELNGEKFDDIEEVQAFIYRRFLPAIAILNESSKVIKYDVFDRLNTGGVVLTPMELRNALHRGNFTRNLHRLSRNSTFRKLWGIPEGKQERKKNSIFRKMLDLEFVLRFFSLERYEDFTDRAKFNGFLSKVMIQKNAEYAVDASQREVDKEAFSRAVECAHLVLGDDAFRKPANSTRRSPRSAPFADAVMHAFAYVDPTKVNKTLASAAKKAIYDQFQKADYAAATGSGTNGRSAIKLRLERTARAVRDALGASAFVAKPARPPTVDLTGKSDSKAQSGAKPTAASDAPRRKKAPDA
jgi:hypothetical protein